MLFLYTLVPYEILFLVTDASFTVRACSSLFFLLLPQTGTLTSTTWLMSLPEAPSKGNTWMCPFFLSVQSSSHTGFQYDVRGEEKGTICKESNLKWLEEEFKPCSVMQSVLERPASDWSTWICSPVVKKHTAAPQLPEWNKTN